MMENGRVARFDARSGLLIYIYLYYSIFAEGKIRLGAVHQQQRNNKRSCVAQRVLFFFIPRCSCGSIEVSLAQNDDEINEFAYT